MVARREEGRKKAVSRWRGAAAVPDEAADEAAVAVEKDAAEEEAAEDAAAAVAVAAADAGATGVGKAAAAGSARSVGTGVESRGVESSGSGVGVGMKGNETGNDIGSVGTHGFAGSAVGARPRSGCTDQTRTTPSSLPLTSQSPVQERRAQSRQQISSVPEPLGSKEASSRSAALPGALGHPPASVPASAPDGSPGRTALERSTSGGWLGLATSHR